MLVNTVDHSGEPYVATQVLQEGEVTGKRSNREVTWREGVCETQQRDLIRVPKEQKIGMDTVQKRYEFLSSNTSEPFFSINEENRQY